MTIFVSKICNVMKKIALLAGVLALFLSSCKMNDEVPPQIYFLVGNPDTAIVGEPYNIPMPPKGVSCDDNFDGKEVEKNLKYTHDIPVSSVSGTMIIPKLTGNYHIYYTLQDDAGNKTDKTLNVVVYNQAQKFCTWYRMKRTSQEHINPDFDIYDNVFTKLVASDSVNNRIIFPKLSNIENLRVYGNITHGDTTLLVNIPMQEVPLVETNMHVNGTDTTYTSDTLLYVIRNTSAGSSYFADTVNFKIILKYDINRYKKTTQGNADYISTDDTYGIYWKNDQQDQCTETYTKM